MTDLPRRRFFDRIRGTPSILAGASRVTGDVEIPGPLMLAGHVIGDGRIEGELIITAAAHWEGNVHAERAIVSGRVTGGIVVGGKIEISRSAIIKGRVSARSIAMARGATVEGDVAVTGTDPIVEFEERRAPRSDFDR